MDVYLIRHAEAANPLASQSDGERPLTDLGRREFARVVQALGAIGVEVDVVLHSPLLRAVQTAELCAPLGGGNLRSERALAEAPEIGLLSCLQALTEMAPKSAKAAQRAILVGHEPWMSASLELLTLGRSAGLTSFRKGSVAWLRGEPKPAGMQLKALWPPKTWKAVNGLG